MKRGRKKREELLCLCGTLLLLFSIGCSTKLTDNLTLLDDEVSLALVETILKTNNVAVRIDKPLVARIKLRKLFESTSTNLRQRRRSVDKLALDKDGDKKVLTLDSVAGLRHVLGTSGITRINCTPLLGLVALIPDDITGKDAIDSPTTGVEHTRVGDLDGHLAQLDAGLPFGLTLLLGSSKLIHTTKSRLVVASDKLGADAPHVDGGILVLECGDEVLIKIVAGKDLSVREASSVQKLTGLDTEPGKITTVETDTGELVASSDELLGSLDGLTDTSDGIVSVDKKHAVVGSGFGPVVKGLLLRGEALDPRVSMGTSDWDAVALTSEDVGCCGTATDVGSTAGGESTIQTLCTTEAELQNRLAEARGADTSGFSGDESAKVDHAQECSLNELGLQDGALDTDERLEGEHDGTLRDGIDIKRQRAHVEKVLEELRVKERLAVVTVEGCEVIDIGLGEAQCVKPLESGLETRADGIATIERLVAVEHVEDGLGVGTASLPVTLSHG